MSTSDSLEDIPSINYLDPNDLEFGFSYFADSENDKEIYTTCVIIVKVRPIVNLNILIMKFSEDSTDNIYTPLSGFERFLQINPKEVYFRPSKEYYNPEKYQYKVEFKASISKEVSKYLTTDLKKIMNDNFIDVESIPKV